MAQEVLKEGKQISLELKVSSIIIRSESINLYEEEIIEVFHNKKSEKKN